ncbi:uncharacterized protein LOC136768528 [Amia ocellicauda]|uniref:uncharacterized protein LOC136768528 n=1 Tax=Amia ocellicauda TaxID=2972642 RepID=UPI0034638CC6
MEKLKGNGFTEEEWTSALSDVIENLESEKYKKMLNRLTDLSSEEKRNDREDMAKVIIQHYGVKESVTVIADVMKKIPRNDDKIVNLLKPFVTAIKQREQEESNGAQKQHKGEGPEGYSLSEMEEHVDDPENCKRLLTGLSKRLPDTQLQKLRENLTFMKLKKTFCLDFQDVHRLKSSTEVDLFYFNKRKDNIFPWAMVQNLLFETKKEPEVKPLRDKAVAKSSVASLPSQGSLPISQGHSFEETEMGHSVAIPPHLSNPSPRAQEPDHTPTESTESVKGKIPIGIHAVSSSTIEEPLFETKQVDQIKQSSHKAIPLVIPPSPVVQGLGQAPTESTQSIVAPIPSDTPAVQGDSAQTDMGESLGNTGSDSEGGEAPFEHHTAEGNASSSLKTVGGYYSQNSLSSSEKPSVGKRAQKKQEEDGRRKQEGLQMWLEGKVRETETDRQKTDHKEEVEALRKHICYINNRKHKTYQCLISERCIVYRASGEERLIDIQLPNDKKQFPQVLTKKGKLVAQYKTKLQFHMGLIGGVSGADVVLLQKGKSTLLTEEVHKESYDPSNYNVLIETVNRFLNEIILPVLALYKTVQREGGEAF